MRMLKTLTAVIFAAALPCLAFAQSSPNLTFREVPTPEQWNSYFSGKQDVLGFTPMNVNGGTFLGRVVTAPPGASTSGLNLTPGTAPGSPADGDLWFTSGGLFARAGGVTIGPLSGITGRVQLAAPLTYYVRVAGSDTNCSGLTNVDDPGSGALPRSCAFATPQKPVNVALYSLDLNNQTVTMNLAGAFTSGISCAGAFVGIGGSTVAGAGSFIITATAGTSITTTNNDAITSSNGCNLTIAAGGNLTLGTVTAGSTLVAYNNGRIAASGINFGPTATTHIQAGWGADDVGGLPFQAGGGQIYITGNYTISGGAGFHWHATTAGSIIQVLSGSTVTLTGTPAFGFFAGIAKGYIRLDGITFSGSATGQRYIIHNGGTLYAPITRTTLPGNVAGVTASGGALVVTDTDNDVGAGYVINAPTTVGALQTCAAGTKGAHAFVTDNNTALSFAAVITSGGSIQTPVYCDGTIWRQG